MRFFATCLLLAAGCVATIVYGGNLLGLLEKKTNGDPAGKPSPDNGGVVEQQPRHEEKTSGAAPQRAPDEKVRIINDDTSTAARPLIIQDGKVQALERREVPSERDGKLLLLATPVPDGEFVPEHKLEKLMVALLGVAWKEGDAAMIKKDEEFRNAPRAITEPFENPKAPGKWYRLPRPGDTLAPGTTEIIRLPLRFRKLAEDDEVQAGQLMGVINPTVALEELASKQAKVEAAAAEVTASASLKAEAIRRERAMDKSRRTVRGSVSDDDYYAAVVTIDRYASEEAAKKAAVIQAQQELSGAWATLDLYFIKAPISGRIRNIYKHDGEAVKNLDAVLQLQNTRRLRVEAQVEVQEALSLQTRVRQAEQFRLEAKKHEKTNAGYAKDLRARADEMTKVQVEITRPVPPKAVLTGHLQGVSCVAVTHGPLPKIVSGSEEGIVRIWERLPGQDRWQQRTRLLHGNTPIRAVACSPKGNHLVTATSRGQVRIFDLGNLKPGVEPTLAGKDDNARHQGAVNAIAISADGKLCATAGEDRSICVWQLPGGELFAKKKAAHNSLITSLAFTPKGVLVSAGRDRYLRTWEVKDGSIAELDSLSGRSAEVATLGLDPSGERVLFDEGRELRVLSLATHGIEGELLNPGAAGAFSTMALFSPDGKTILTNGNGPGRLQLWRAPSRENRAAELRQFLWTTGQVTCGAFDPSPNPQFAVTGTSDHRVLVWELPKKDEAEKPSDAFLTYVEENFDSGFKRVTVRATVTNAPEGVLTGSSASIVVPPAKAEK